MMAKEEKQKRTCTVIYRPAPDEPAVCEQMGMKFPANVAVELSRDNPAHYSQQLVRTVVTHPAGFGKAFQFEEQMVFIGDSLVNNCFFSVDGNPPPRRMKNTRVLPPPGTDWGARNDGAIVYADFDPNSVDPGADAVMIGGRR